MNRRLGGKQARQVGNDFEHWVSAHHEIALKLGLVIWIAQVGPPTNPMKFPGLKFVVRIANGPGPVDYMGLLPGGRGLCVEAKSRRDRLDRSEIEDHQVAQLDAYARSGALALLVCEIRHEKAALWSRTRYAVPWLAVPWRKRRTAEAVDDDDLAPWIVRHDCYLRPFVA